MHPLYPHSTDVLYSQFPLEEMAEIARAHDAPNIYFVTKACLTPERALYHACVKYVQARLKNSLTDENIRGQLIADRADAIYELVHPEFMRQLTASQPEMERKYAMVREFMATLSPEEGKPWNAAGFDAAWPPERFPYRWQRKAIETYRLVKDNIASGAYTPSPGWDAAKVTHYWSDRNLEYKHYRDLARQLVNAAIDKTFPESAHLIYALPKERKTIIVTGGMASGKSVFTQAYLASLDEQTRSNLVLHDTDHVKLAFARSAIREGKIAEYTGPETHNESSIALYENTRQRHYLARKGKPGPHALINTTAAGKFELEDGLEGGGQIIIHHLSIEPAQAVAAAHMRQDVSRRRPDVDVVRRSCTASTQNLLAICGYAGKPITVHLHVRDNGAPVEIGIMDIGKREIQVLDAAAFMHIAERSGLAEDKNASRQLFISTLLQHGMTITFQSPEIPTESMCSLLPDRTLQLHDPAAARLWLKTAPGNELATFGGGRKIGGITYPESGGLASRR